MPALIPILIAVLLSSVFRVLVAIGIGFITFTYSIPAFYSFLQSQFASLPPEVYNVVGILKIDICMTIMISAVITRLIYKVAAAPLISLGGGS